MLENDAQASAPSTSVLAEACRADGGKSAEPAGRNGTDGGEPAGSIPAAIVPNCTFNGNPLLKRENVSVGLTQWHLDELQRCIADPVYFAENYMKVIHVDRGLVPLKLYDYQKKMLKAMDEHRYSIILSCRQSGKCVCASAEVTASHPSINGGKPFRTSAGSLWRMAKKISQSA